MSTQRTVPREIEPRWRPIVSAAAILRAAARVWWYERGRAPLPELVSSLRETGPARQRLDAHLTASLLERVLPVLPPYSAGRCVKRSLMLLDLWSRAGFATRLHVGIRRDGIEGREGHVWVTTDDDAVRTFLPPDVVETCWF